MPLDEEQADLNGKVAVAIRTARAMAGINQEDFAMMMRVAKSTVARIETLEMKATAEFLLEAIYYFKTIGIEIDMHNYDHLIIKMDNQTITNVAIELENTSKRLDKKVEVKP